MAITQACKTIIFEEFSVGERYADGASSDKLDYYLNSPPTQEDLENIEKTLGVGSYEEFLSKFQPVIYQEQLSDESHQEMIFRYSLEKPKGNYTEINITNEKFYKMVIDLYESKGKGGVNNLDFDYESIKEVLTPKKSLDDAYRLRRKLDNTLEKIIMIGEKNPYEKRKLSKQFIEYRKEIVEKFFSGNYLTFLPLALEDAQKKIDFIDQSRKNLKLENNGAGGEPVKLLPCTVSFADDGKIKIKQEENAVSDDKPVRRIGVVKQQKLLSIVSNDFEQYKSEDMKSQYVENLVISTFTGGGQLEVSDAEREKYVELRDAYARIYKKAQESFAKQMISLVEKFVNVRAFFDNATDGSKKPMKHKVIIANTRVKDLMADGIKENFIKYINLLGQQYNDKKIWYAVVPAVDDKDFRDDDEEDGDIDIDGDLNLGESFEYESITPLCSDRTTFTQFKEFVSMLSDAKIMTFFNFKGNEKTGFALFNEEIIKKYKDKCSQIGTSSQAYTTLCYPNFTLLPKSKTRSSFCKVTEETFDEYGISVTTEKECYLDSPSVYIDSSYIACALMISAHDINILQKKGFSINEKDPIPAVRFDFEGSFINKNYSSSKPVPCYKVLTTGLNRESVYADQERDRAIGKFGFCFGCNDIKSANIDSNTPIANSYVVCARTIAPENSDNKSQYRPIFKTLVSTFLKMQFSFDGSSNIFKETINKWQEDKAKKYINNPLFEVKNGDETFAEYIELVAEDGKMRAKVHYGDSTEPDELYVED